VNFELSGWVLLTRDHRSSLEVIFEFFCFCVVSFVSVFGLFMFGLMLRVWLTQLTKLLPFHSTQPYPSSWQSPTRTSWAQSFRDILDNLDQILLHLTAHPHALWLIPKGLFLPLHALPPAGARREVRAQGEEKPRRSK
jgi:hypothetical protein